MTDPKEVAPSQPSPLTWEQKRDAVISGLPDAVCHKWNGPFGAAPTTYTIYPNRDIFRAISAECDDEPDAWGSAYTRLFPAAVPEQAPEVAPEAKTVLCNNCHEAIQDDYGQWIHVRTKDTDCGLFAFPVAAPPAPIPAPQDGITEAAALIDEALANMRVNRCKEACGCCDTIIAELEGWLKKYAPAPASEQPSPEAPQEPQALLIMTVEQVGEDVFHACTTMNFPYGMAASDKTFEGVLDKMQRMYPVVVEFAKKNGRTSSVPSPSVQAPSGEQAVNELPPLDVTEGERMRAKRDCSPAFQVLGGRILCRERQLLAAQQRIAELNDKVANGIPLVAHHALLKAAKDEWDRLAELSRKPVVEGLPPRPQVKVVPNHGFGFSAYCDAAELKTYADAAEARIAAVEAERDEARKQLSAKPKYGCAWCHFVPEGEPETLWPQVQEHLMLCEKRWHGNDAVTYFRNLVNEQRRRAETAEASLAQQAAHEAIYIARAEAAEQSNAELRAERDAARERHMFHRNRANEAEAKLAFMQQDASDKDVSR